MSVKNLIKKAGLKRRAARAEAPTDDEDQLEAPEDEELESDEPETEGDDEEALEDEPEESAEGEEDDDDALAEDEDEELLAEEEDGKEQAASKARSEALEIMQLCRLYGKPQLAEKFLAKGFSVKSVKSRLLALRDKQLKQAGSSQTISNKHRTRTVSGGVVAATKHKLGVKE